MTETDPKKIAQQVSYEHKDRQLMNRVAKAARHLVKWIHNQCLIKGEDVHLVRYLRHPFWRRAESGRVPQRL
jgi:hypothetical protein